MASAEQLLISKVIADGSVTDAIDYGIRTEHLSGTIQEVWIWLVNFWQEHGEVPTLRALQSDFASASFGDASKETLSRLVEEVIENYRRRHLTAALADAVPLLTDGDSTDALALLSSTLQELAGTTSVTKDVDLIETYKERLDKYADIRANPEKLLGIPTGFPTLDLLTSGFRPEQLVTLVGEAKRGKSMMALVMAIAANDYGIAPMVVSFEMSADEVAARHDAYIGKVSHSGLLRGESSHSEVVRLERELMIRKNRSPFTIIEDISSSTTVGGLAAKIDQHKPGLLIVDGAYMMDDENNEPKGSPQALTNITRSLKRLAQRSKIPIIITTQVLSAKLSNRTSRRVTADAIGYSSSFAQDSDIVMAVERDPDHEDRSIVRIVESRICPRGEVTVKWDWDKMDFSEVEPSEDDPDDDDDSNDDYDNW